jgi:hypothetical protein
MSPTAGEDMISESPPFWRPALANACLILGSIMLAGITARFVLGHVYLYPTPRLGPFGQSAIAFAFLGIGWLSLPERAPLRLLFELYFLVLGAMLAYGAFSGGLLAHRFSSIELGLMACGVAVAGIGILLAKTGDKPKHPGDAV